MKRISYYGKSYTVVLLVYDRLNFENKSLILKHLNNQLLLYNCNLALIVFIVT